MKKTKPIFLLLILCIGIFAISCNPEKGHVHPESDAIYVAPNGDVGIGTDSPASKLDVNGRIRDTLGYVMPRGCIVMWSGAVDAVPAGWALCNGSNGTPDLQDRFIVGAGKTYAVGATGGNTSTTLTTDQMPAHSHSGSSGSTEVGLNYEGVVWDSEGVQSQGIVLYNGSDLPHNRPNAAGTKGMDNPSGIGHSHPVSVGSTGKGDAFENRPPYFALCYIMKL